MARLRLLRVVVVCLATTAGLAACEAPPPPVFPKLTWNHLQPIQLDVRSMKVVGEYNSPMAPPNVEHLFPVIPERAMQGWARDRLRATGPSGEANFIIKDAKAIEVPLRTQSGVKGMLTDDQAQRYDLTLVAELELRDPTNQRGGHIQSEARRSRSVSQSISLNDREKVWFEMVEGAMNDLNASLERQINEHLTDFVR